VLERVEKVRLEYGSSPLTYRDVLEQTKTHLRNKYVRLYAAVDYRSDTPLLRFAVPKVDVPVVSEQLPERFTVSLPIDASVEGVYSAVSDQLGGIEVLLSDDDGALIKSCRKPWGSLDKPIHVYIPGF
jgi:hypothetical protein